MAYETVVAAFDTRAHAEAAVKALKAGGFADSDISIIDRELLAASKKAGGPGAKAAAVWYGLFGHEVHQHEAAIYSQTIDRGGAVVSARVMDSEVAHALAILNMHHPVDVHDRAVTSGIASTAHVEAVEKKIESVPLAAPQKVAVPPKLADAHDEVLGRPRSSWRWKSGQERLHAHPPP
jgi:hypothetical protein